MKYEVGKVKYKLIDGEREIVEYENLGAVEMSQFPLEEDVINLLHNGGFIDVMVAYPEDELRITIDWIGSGETAYVYDAGYLVGCVTEISE